MLHNYWIWGFLVALMVLTSFGEALKAAPQNPHYYSYRGEPIILITSAERYGAVTNKDFAYFGSV